MNFDDAFHSRIHLTLRFPSLSLDSRTAVWRTFIDPVTTELSNEQIYSLAEKYLNGRQIKNVIKMARLVAKSTNSALQYRHIEDVLDIVMENA